MTAIGLSLAWNVVMTRRDGPGSLDLCQSPRQRNQIRILRYVHDRPDAPAVLVGSSLTNRILTDRLPVPAVNLGLNQLTPLDGLEIVDRMGLTPTWIFIETNVVHKGTDLSLVDEVLDPFTIQLQQRFPALREDREPAWVFSPYFFSAYFQLRHRLAHDPSGSEGLGSSAPRPVEERALFGHRQDWYDEHGGPEGVAWGLERFEDILGRLRNRGIRIGWIHLPMHPGIEASETARAIREQVPRVAASAGDGVAPDWTGVYRTDDGVHLVPESARAFTGELSRWMERVMQAVQSRSHHPSRNRPRRRGSHGGPGPRPGDDSRAGAEGKIGAGH